MRRSRALGGIAAALMAVAAPGSAWAAPEPQPGSTWTIQIENDKISTTDGGSDRFYSNGLRLGWTSGTDMVPQAVADAARVVWGDGIVRISFNLTHQIFTPIDTARVIPDPLDRPLAGYLAGKLVHRAVGSGQGHHGAEAGRTVGLASQLAQQLGHVVGGQALGTGVAGRVHARLTAQGGYFQAGIIGEAAHAVVLAHVFGLLAGVACEGVLGFG